MTLLDVSCAMIRRAIASETHALVALAESTGLFDPAEADALLRSTLDDLHAGKLGDGHCAFVWADDVAGAPAGWVYTGPDANADRVWNLWWIGVSPARHGKGIGEELLKFVEEHVRDARGRVLVIETSSLARLDKTRRFYAKRGYAACGRIPDFYAEGDDKVIFAKRLAAPAPDDARPLSG